jgi:hypothetical protein
MSRPTNVENGALPRQTTMEFGDADVTDISSMKKSFINPKKRTEEVLCISFNQDKSCIACGTNYGYKIYSTKNFQKVGDRDMDCAIARIQMLFRSNLLLLVKGTPENPRIAGNHLIFWDDRANDSTGELVLNHNINKIKMRKDLY